MCDAQTPRLPSQDPLIVAAQLDVAITPDVLEHAVNYRESLVQGLRWEIAVLKVRRAQLLSESPVRHAV